MELGVNYNTDFQDINLSFGVVGQTGRLKVQNKFFQGLEVGTNINYRNFTWGGSYGYLGNGLAQTKKNNPFWTAGVGYAQGPVTFSITYFKSKLYKSTNNIANKLSNMVIGMDYRVSKGFLPYFEIARFKMSYTEALSSNNNSLNKGVIILTGCKIKF
jgi:predicted porin